MGLGAAIGGWLVPALTAILPDAFAGAIPEIASGLGSGLVGAGGGAALSGITGGNPLTGALTGGLTGGAIGGLGGEIGNLTGLGLTGGDVLAGLGAGALGSAITGGNPLTGAAEGGAGGLVSGLLSTPSASTAGTTTPTPVSGAGSGAAGIAAPAATTIDPLATGTFGDQGAIGTAGPPGASSLGTGGATTDPFASLGSAAGAAGAADIPASSSSGGISNFFSNLFGDSSPTTVAPNISNSTTTLDAAGTPTNLALPDTSIPSSSSGGALSNIGGGVLNFAKSNPGLLLAGGGLALDAALQPKLPSISSSTGALENTANQLSTQGTQLQQYLQTGTLPPGVQAGLNEAAQQAKATITSKYAAMGGGAEASSAAQQDLANVDVVTQTQGANLALQLLQEGVSEDQISAQLYQSILTSSLQQDQQLGNAITAFGAAMVPRTVTTVGAT
jgi:hypothetical protein